MKIDSTVATLYIMNRNCKSPSLPCYDQIKIYNKKYPIVNLDKYYIHQLIKDLYSEEFEEEYYTFTVRVTGDIIKSKGVMPNPMVDIEHFINKELKYIP